MRAMAALFLGGGIWLSGAGVPAFADGPGQQTYPRVIGPSGRPYGPTQAHYQYEKRYGRSWDGTVTGNQGYPIGTRSTQGGFYSGYDAGHHHHHHYGNASGWGWGLGGFGVGITTVGTYGGYPVSIYSGPGYAWNYNPVVTPGFYDPYSIPGGYIYEAPSTYVVPPVPWGGVAVPLGVSVAPDPGVMLPAPVMERDLNLPRVFGLPQDNSLDGALRPIVPQSTPEAKLRSIQDQARGDEQLLKLNYPAASQSYRKAIQTAQDRVEPIYRYGLVLVAQARYADAVQQFKLASSLDSTWPQSAPNLDTLFGQKNTMEKVQIKHRVAEWTQQNVRDPDRIYLLSLMLHLDEDARGQTLIDTALRIGGPQPHLAALKVPRQPDPAGALLQPGPLGVPGIPQANPNGAPKGANAPAGQPGPLPAP